MPTNDSEDIGLLYFKVEDDTLDNWTPIPNVICDVITDADVATKNADKFSWKQPIELRFRVKQKEKISRKKFKKWLMSLGFERDVSEWICWYVGIFQGAVSRKDIYRLFSNPLNPLVYHDGPTPVDIFTAIALKGAKEWNSTK